MISRQVHDRRRDYAAQFAAGQPFRHVAIDDFLDTRACQALLDQFPTFEERYALNEMGRPGNKAVRTDVDGLADAYRALDAQVRSPEFLGLVSDITGIPDLRYDPDYIGGGTHENRHGQGLDPHIDFNILPGRQWHRRLNLIIYLNPAWEESWGGCIELHSNPWSPAENQRRSFLPAFNRCVIFETNEHSWHGFETIRLPPAQYGLSRKSFAIYLYTEQRDDQQAVPSHGTVYVPAGMPSHLAPGAILDADAHADLERRFAHLLDQMQFLYRRELEFSRQIEQLREALDESTANLKIDLEGRLRQQRGTRGYWPDGWFGREASVDFFATESASAIDLAFWVPAEMHGVQELSVSLGDSEEHVNIKPGRTTRLTIAADMWAGREMRLEFRSARVWRPSDSGQSADSRELAFRLQEAVLRHR